MLKKIAKAFVVAFSIYSKVPMPQFKWESEDMQYHLCFFPWVGALIGGAEFGWFLAVQKFHIGGMLALSLALALPLIITGGFHLDGFLDTSDALHSYGRREKKLEILKAPHIGAFAVICLVILLLLSFGFLSEVQGVRIVGIGCANFFLARVLSGISVVTFRCAGKSGMLQTFSTTAARKTVLIVLVLQGILCAALEVWLNPLFGGICVILALLVWAYYRLMSYRQFGGITGDLAGFFVTVEEAAVVIALGILCMIF